MQINQLLVCTRGPENNRERITPVFLAKYVCVQYNKWRLLTTRVDFLCLQFTRDTVSLIMYRCEFLFFTALQQKLKLLWK